MNVLLVAEYCFANPDFVRLAEELAHRKHEVTVATSFRTVDKAAQDGEVRVFEIKPLVTIYRIPHTLSFPLLKLAEIVKKRNIDVIHALNDHSTNVAVSALVAEAVGIPFVYTIQGPGTRTGHPLVDSIVGLYDLTVERWLSKEAQRVILLSKGLLPIARKLRVEKEKIAVIPSGIDSTFFDPARVDVNREMNRLRLEYNLSNEVIVGYVGRLDPAKGLTYLFSAVEAIQDKCPNIALLIVGDGALRDTLERRAKNLQVRTIFAGWQRNVAPYYHLMDVFVLPSLFEGLPNVILEAMAMRTPVIATNVGGSPDVLSNGENGFLVPAGDIQRLASALETLVKDNRLRVKMGNANRQKVEENFAWSKTVRMVEKIYSELVSVGQSTEMPRIQ